MKGNIIEDDPQKNGQSIIMNSVSFKIILIGESSTGKTSMIRSYIHGKFQNHYHVTVGVDFSSKTIKVGNSYVQFQIWDTCGQDMYQSMTKSFYRGAAAVFLVYSVNSRSSFQKAQTWLNSFRQEGSPLAFMFLIGTKVDLKRQVQQQQALDFLKKNKGAFFIETSSLTGQNINKKAADVMFKTYEANKQFQQFVNPKRKSNFTLKRRSTILSVYTTEVKRKQCCQ